MNYNYIGSIKGASLVVKKRQRKRGRSKNVYYLGMAYEIYDKHADEITRTLTGFGGMSDGTRNNFMFTKRPADEKAWAWFLLKFA